MTLHGNQQTDRPTLLCFSIGQRAVCRQERPFRFLEMDMRDGKRAIEVVLLAFGGKQHLPLTVDIIFYLPSVYTWWTLYYHSITLFWLAGWLVNGNTHRRRNQRKDKALFGLEFVVSWWLIGWRAGGRGGTAPAPAAWNVLNGHIFGTLPISAAGSCESFLGAPPTRTVDICSALLRSALEIDTAQQTDKSVVVGLADR